MEGKTESQQKLADLYEESESLWNTKIKDNHILRNLLLVYLFVYAMKPTNICYNTLFLVGNIP